MKWLFSRCIVVQEQKEAYRQHRRTVHGDVTDVFAHKAVNRTVSQIAPVVPSTLGPTPFSSVSNATAMAMASALSRTQPGAGQCLWMFSPVKNKNPGRPSTLDHPLFVFSYAPFLPPGLICFFSCIFSFIFAFLILAFLWWHFQLYCFSELDLEPMTFILTLDLNLNFYICIPKMKYVSQGKVAACTGTDRCSGNWNEQNCVTYGYCLCFLYLLLL